MFKQPAVYILASKKNGILYIGLTSDLKKRVWLHKEEVLEGFTKKYHIHILVYFEVHRTMREAIIREKQMKWWKRKWKVQLIEETNPKWRDLYDEIGY